MYKIKYMIMLIKSTINPAMSIPQIIGAKQSGKYGLQKMLAAITIVMIKDPIASVKSLIQSTNIFFIILPPKFS